MLKKEPVILTQNGRSAIPLDLDEYLSAAQYRKIVELAADLECDPDQASRTLFDVPAEALSESGAADVIEYLERLKG